MIIDTHVALWIVSDPSRVPKSVLDAVGSANRPVYISAVVTWEIAVKTALGKVTVAPDFRERLFAYGYVSLPVSDDHAWAVRHLPHHHRDPFDRLLVAQAQTEGATLVSADPVMSRYDVPVLWG